MVPPDCSFHSQTLATKASRPISRRPSVAGAGELALDDHLGGDAGVVEAGLPERRRRPRMRCQRARMSISVWLKAWPMCRLPVTLGGGSRMEKGSAPGLRVGAGAEGVRGFPGGADRRLGGFGVEGLFHRHRSRSLSAAALSAAAGGGKGRGWTPRRQPASLRRPGKGAEDRMSKFGTSQSVLRKEDLRFLTGRGALPRRRGAGGRAARGLLPQPGGACPDRAARDRGGGGGARRARGLARRQPRRAARQPDGLRAGAQPRPLARGGAAAADPGRGAGCATPASRSRWWWRRRRAAAMDAAEAHRRRLRRPAGACGDGGGRAGDPPGGAGQPRPTTGRSATRRRWRRRSRRRRTRRGSR